MARLVTLGMLSFPALREYYSYIHNPACKRMGSSLWLMVAIGAVETLIVFKFYLQDPGMVRERNLFVCAFCLCIFLSLQRLKKFNWLKSQACMTSAPAAIVERRFMNNRMGVVVCAVPLSCGHEGAGARYPLGDQRMDLFNQHVFSVDGVALWPEKVPDVTEVVFSYVGSSLSVEFLTFGLSRRG